MKALTLVSLNELPGNDNKTDKLIDSDNCLHCF